MTQITISTDDSQEEFFQPLHGTVGMREIWSWWERRRYFYNLVVVLSSIISFTMYAFFLLNATRLSSGEEFIEPMALLAALILGPISWNVFYCLGPILDFVFSAAECTCGPQIMKVLILLSVAIISFPAVYWGIQFLRVIFLSIHSVHD